MKPLASAVPAKAGTHLSTAAAAERCTPAFAGEAFDIIRCHEPPYFFLGKPDIKPTEGSNGGLVAGAQQHCSHRGLDDRRTGDGLRWSQRVEIPDWGLDPVVEVDPALAA